MMSGKWHLGIGRESPPSAKGFERSFALFQGEHNHFGYDQTLQTAGYVGPSRYALDGEDVQYPLGTYSSDCFADRMIDFLDESSGDGRPLFGYLAFTAPHCPLQAPTPLIAKYRGRYDDGPELLRERRLGRMKKLGMSAGSVAPAELRGPAPWADLPPGQRALEARKMEVYASMVDAMDSAIGRVVDALERTGRLGKTMVVFVSDNGPAGTLRERSPGWRDWIERHADNRLDNIGAANSYTSIGPRWAQAQAAPFFLFKRYTTEGGVRTCALASGVGVPSRVESDAFIHAMDLAPTFLELAGIDPAPSSGKIPMRGKSCAGVLQGRQSEVHRVEEVIAWELAYGRAVRKGEWKAVYLPPAARSIADDIPTSRWLLFNVASDPAESNDLSAREPQKLRELVDAWDAYARDTGVVLSPD
jgi:arylsulfatase A-like enzyme